jgi:hypothetical protein
MSTDPLRGHAVHAPIFSEPKATPRVTVSQVALSPMTAARKSAKQEPKNRRTFVPI